MEIFVLLTLFVFVVEVVVGSNLVSVMEGDSVTLKSDVTKQGRDKMLWYFNDTLIALINGDPSKSCLYDGEGEIFRDRLEVDFETGSLTITNIGPEHTGRYEANFIKSKSSGTSQSLNRNGKCDSTKIIKKMINIGDTVKTFSVSIRESYNVEKKQESEQSVVGDDVVTMSVMEGDSVALYSGVTKQQRDKMLWYFNDTLIALVNGDPSKSCVYYGEGEIFRDRLKVDYATGSLTVKNIRPEHTGRYAANFIQSKSSGTSHSLNRNSKCDGTKIIKNMINTGDTIKTFSVSVTAHLSGPDKISKESYIMGKVKECEKRLSLNLILGICAGVGVVLLLAAAVVGVVYFCCRSSNKEDMKKNQSKHLLKVPV